MSAVQMQPTKTITKADKELAKLKKQNYRLQVEMELMLKLHQAGALRVQPQAVQLPAVQLPAVDATKKKRQLPESLAPAKEAPKKKRAKKDPDAPKKAPSEYNNFVAAKTEELKKRVFDADNAQNNSRLRMKEIGRLWKAFVAERQMGQPGASRVWEEEKGVEPVVVVD